MTQRIITGYVDSPGGRDALALAEILAGIDPDHELLVTSVYAYNPPEEPAEPSGWRKVLRERADAELAPVRERLGERADVTIRPSCGMSPADGLHRLAAAEHATVAVVGVSHNHGMRRVRAGSITEQTIVGSPCAVAIAPSGYAEQAAPPKTVAVAFNGSGESQRALDVAAEIARKAGAELRIVGVVEPAAVWYAAYGGSDVAGDLTKIVRDDLTAAAGRVEGVERIDVRVLTGEAVRAINEASDDADLLVLGSRGYGPVRRVLLGSVSAKLVRDPACPLLVLPRTAVDDEQ
ncbi:MAG: universal stress protein [Patulibacter sp.]|nr:universal stress protein [Patulibacter sp.]